jgi:5-methylcytosine-specific restriction protein B
MIPPVEREKLVSALEEFDRTLRNKSDWKGWEDNRAQKWAIDHEGKLYPPKKIISMATGQPVNGFSGGIESNDYVKQRGFNVVSLREGIKSIQEGLETILDGYIPVRESEPFNSRNVIAETFEQIARILRATDAVRKRPTIKTVISYGKGNWANVPWIAFLDDRETTTTQHGVYAVFLFKDDGAGVYLTYNQGVTDIIKAQGRQKGQEQLQQLAKERRVECAWLSDRGFLLDNSISLSQDTGLGRDYEASTIAHKLYLKGAVPNDEAILNDLESVLAAYDQYVGHKTVEIPKPPISPGSKEHWLFQANPKYYDIRGALNDLQELTWSINQTPTKFRAGQTGYLWESGPNGGIIAHGTLLTDPTESESDPGEDKYFTAESDLGGRRLRVRLHVDQVLNEPIPRQSLLDHPTLKSLAVLRFANATNYTLSDDEYDAIGSLAKKVEPILDLEAIVTAFSDALRASFVDFGQDHLVLVRAFVSSLATKPLVILTGLSGSGKTQLALRFGEWLGGARLYVAAVRPDWTGAEALFGYEDALKPVVEGKPAWNVPATLAFLLRAAGDPKYPYVLILDEMNLAHVERYFADVLSGMESGKPVLPNLFKDADGYWRQRKDADEKIPFPQNVFVVGTVNIDETTYMFSPKVLDRANTFEFRVKTSDLASTHRKPLVCSEGHAGLIRGFLEIATNSDWHLEAGHSKAGELADQLRTLHTVMSKYGFEFGHRVFYEAMRFAALNEAAGESSLNTALDRIVMQKLLPRIHGSRRRIERLLLSLSQYCFDYSIPSLSGGVTDQVFNPESIDASRVKLPYSFDKLLRMLRSLRANQFTSFTE